MELIDELSPEYLESIDWEASIVGVSPNTCDRFYTRFFEAAKTAEEQGNTRSQSVFVLLGRASSLFLKAAEKQAPFGPMWIYEGRRSADISDFTEDDIECLKSLLSVLKQNDLRARVADIIWTVQRKGNIQYAEQAVDDYLLAGEEQIYGDIYIDGVERLTRALHLAASLGRNSDRYDKVIQKIDFLLGTFLPKHNSPMSDLLKLLLEYRAGDTAKFAHFAEIGALDAEANNNWYVAGHYWEIKAKCHRMEKEVDREYQAIQRVANTYVNTANDSLKQAQRHSVAAYHIQSAIEVLRRIPGTKEQQDQLHKTMLEYQQKSVNELKSISSDSIDLTEQIENTITIIKDKPLKEAIFLLASFTNPVSRAGMASFIEEMAQKSPFLALLTNNIVDSNGKVIGKIGSLLDDSKDKAEEAKEAEMFHWAHYQQQTLGAVIDHTRHYFVIEHNPSIRDTLEIVTNNPFVPAGREWIFAQGLLSGLQGDYLMALHLLLPQIENSIRSLLNRNGVITSGLNPEGIQEEFHLNKLLYMPETAKIFHENLIFGLRGTLISRFGANFRNRLAHGLLEHNHFLTYDAVYIWWLVLKICCMPMVQPQESKDAPSKE